jgi:hypothetical protein
METFYLRNLPRILLLLIFLLLLSPAFPQRISELPAATYMGIGDLMPIVQNGVTKKLPFAGLTGSLHFLEDSLFVKYRCHKIKGASQWYFSSDTIYIDTCNISIPPGPGGTDSLFFAYGCKSGLTKWYYSSDTIFLDTCFVAGTGDSCLFDIADDTIFNKNRYKVKFTDSVYFSNYCIPHLEEGEKFMGFLTLKSFVGDVKQLAYATPQQAADSLAVNFDTLSYYLRIVDERLSPINLFWDGRGGFIGTGNTRYKSMPFSGTITGWSIVAIGSSPSCTIDIWHKTYSTSLPTVANTIMGTKPALSSGNVIRSSSLTGWTPVAFSAGDIFGFNIDACSNATWISITLEIQ